MHKILLLIYLFFYSFSFSQNAIELNNSASIKYNNKDYKGAVLDLNKAIIIEMIQELNKYKYKNEPKRVPITSD